MNEIEWLRGAISKRLMKLTGAPLPHNAINVKEAYASGTLVKYMLKGIDGLYAPGFYIDPVDQGKIIGQRTGTSRNIGKTIRANKNWKRKRTVKKLRN